MAGQNWQGESIFRILSFEFGIQWNSQELWDAVFPIIAQFEVAAGPGVVVGSPTSGSLPLYSFVEYKPPEHLRLRVLFGVELLSGSDLPGVVVDVFLWHLNIEVARRSNEFLLVHAGAVSTPTGEGVLLPAPSGSGKSTLVAGLVRAGFGYLSDEAACIEPSSGEVYPYPKAISLSREVVREVFPDLAGVTNGLGHQQYLHPDRLRPLAVVGPCPVRYVISHRYQAGASTTVTPLTPARAALELARNGINLSTYRERALPLLAGLVREAGCFRLIHGDLHEGVGAISRLTEAGSPDQFEKTSSSLEAKSPS